MAQRVWISVESTLLAFCRRCDYISQGILRWNDCAFNNCDASGRRFYWDHMSFSACKKCRIFLLPHWASLCLVFAEAVSLVYSRTNHCNFERSWESALWQWAKCCRGSKPWKEQEIKAKPDTTFLHGKSPNRIMEALLVYLQTKLEGTYQWSFEAFWKVCFIVRAWCLVPVFFSPPFFFPPLFFPFFLSRFAPTCLRGSALWQCTAL